jgi:hypothetical protein
MQSSSNTLLRQKNKKPGRIKGLDQEPAELPKTAEALLTYRPK